MTEPATMIPPWSTRPCDTCGDMHLATRQEPRPEPSICEACEAYDAGAAAEAGLCEHCSADRDTIEKIRAVLGDDTGRVVPMRSGPDGMHVGDEERDSEGEELVDDVRRVRERAEKWIEFDGDLVEAAAARSLELAGILAVYVQRTAANLPDLERANLGRDLEAEFAARGLQLPPTPLFLPTAAPEAALEVAARLRRADELEVELASVCRAFEQVGALATRWEAWADDLPEPHGAIDKILGELREELEGGPL